MKVGIDLSPLQGPHRMRGVGSVIINFLNNIPESQKQKHEFVFFMNSHKENDKTLKLLDLSNLNYELRDKPMMKSSTIHGSFKGFRILTKLINKPSSLLRFRLGNKGYDYSDLDFYLHTDQLEIMPRMPRVKKIMIAYDIIPYLLEWDYLWSYKTARHMGFEFKDSVIAQLNRHTYIKKLKINIKKTYRVIAISKQTADDFIKFVKVPEDKVSVIHLGINPPDKSKEPEVPTKRYFSTSWGYFSKLSSFDTSTPFILFIGGTDARRKLDDLVTAFNLLRAQGHKLKLVLSGDILQGPDNLPVKTTREALLNSSYAKDIIYLGFTTEPVKAWLYEHALAFIYPSKYEGFGLPVLEAMSYGTPVICYDTGAIREIAENMPYYSNDAKSMEQSVEKLLNMDIDAINKLHKNYISHSKKFTWAKTSEQILKMMKN